MGTVVRVVALNAYLMTMYSAGMVYGMRHDPLVQASVAARNRQELSDLLLRHGIVFGATLPSDFTTLRHYGSAPARE